MYLQVFDFRNTNPQQEGNITKCRQNAQKILSCDYPKIGGPTWQTKRVLTAIIHHFGRQPLQIMMELEVVLT
jgi:hypothetical protein